MSGLLILFAVAATILSVTVAVALLYQLRHPPRKTLAFALAHEWPTSPGDLDMAYEEHVLTLHDQTQTTLWTVQGTGDPNSTMIALHGYGESRFRTLSYLPILAKYAGQIIVPDVRAHGDATSKLSTFASMEHKDVFDIADRFCGDKQIVLWGHSFGAAVCIAAAAVEPHRFSAVIADGPYARLLKCIIRTLQSRRYPAYPFAWLVDWHFRFWQGDYRQYDPIYMIPQLTCPLLVIHGDKDPVAPIEEARQLAKLTANGQFIDIYDGGHGNIHLVEPDRYDAVINDFLSDLPNPPQADTI